MNFLDSIKDFCAEIGRDPLLVQGAGGNISVKNKNVLWIKASGTWIADAKIQQIFTPVDLESLNKALKNLQYDVLPVALGVNPLRPSIETLLHVVMPHKIVLHIHAIEALAYLVQANAEDHLAVIFGDSISWKFIPYIKPGADLAQAVHMSIKSLSNIDIVFLGNHGVVIGGNSLKELIATLGKMRKMLNNQPKITLQKDFDGIKKISKSIAIKGYVKCRDAALNELATNPFLMHMVESAWALYPDHVVFLGSKPLVIEVDDIQKTDFQNKYEPPFIFIRGFGVLEDEGVTKAQKVQLRAFYDVLIRQQSSENLNTLNQQQISQLLNWDAEKYRQKM